MKTIDNIIDVLVDKGLNNLHPSIPLRDLKILKNISNIMKNELYITEAQGNLLVKILKENLEYIDNNELDIATNLKIPSWNKSFRKVEKIREVSIEEKEKGKLLIKIELSFDKEIKKIISILGKNLDGELIFGGPKVHYYTFVERNILIIHDTLKPLKFKFSSEFLEFYDKIKIIDCDTIKNKFNFNNFYEEKKSLLQKFESLDSNLIVIDRKIRYQYDLDENFNNVVSNSLASKIATRKSVKIFVSSYKISFNELMNSLEELERNKVLLVFDAYDVKECISYLNALTQYVKDKNKNDSVGIYFRFDNKGDGETFNKIISSNKLNNILTNTSKIVGINNGKVPKFLLKSDWYPDAVITFTNGLRSNKTEVYCNDCDLVIYYTDIKPLTNKCDEIL